MKGTIVSSKPQGTMLLPCCLVLIQPQHSCPPFTEEPLLEGSPRVGTRSAPSAHVSADNRSLRHDTTDHDVAVVAYQQRFHESLSAAFPDGAQTMDSTSQRRAADRPHEDRPHDAQHGRTPRPEGNGIRSLQILKRPAFSPKSSVEADAGISLQVPEAMRWKLHHFHPYMPSDLRHPRSARSAFFDPSVLLDSFVPGPSAQSFRSSEWSEDMDFAELWRSTSLQLGPAMNPKLKAPEQVDQSPPQSTSAARATEQVEATSDVVSATLSTATGHRTNPVLNFTDSSLSSNSSISPDIVNELVAILDKEEDADKPRSSDQACVQPSSEAHESICMISDGCGKPAQSSTFQDVAPLNIPSFQSSLDHKQKSCNAEPLTPQDFLWTTFSRRCRERCSWVVSRDITPDEQSSRLQVSYPESYQATLMRETLQAMMNSETDEDWCLAWLCYGFELENESCILDAISEAPNPTRLSPNTIKQLANCMIAKWEAHRPKPPVRRCSRLSCPRHSVCSECCVLARSEYREMQTFTELTLCSGLRSSRGVSHDRFERLLNWPVFQSGAREAEVASLIIGDVTTLSETLQKELFSREFFMMLMGLNVLITSTDRSKAERKLALKLFEARFSTPEVPLLANSAYTARAASACLAEGYIHPATFRRMVDAISNCVDPVVSGTALSVLYLACNFFIAWAKR